MNCDSVPATDTVAKASVRANGNGRACTRATVLDTVDDVTVRSGGEARLESRTPTLVGVVDDHESRLSPPESDKLGRGRDPVGDIRGLNSVPETDHSGDGGPAMLAIPAVSSAIAGTGAVVSVGSTRISVGEQIAGENGRRAKGMGQDPHMSKCVHVVCGVDRQGVPIAFGIMVDNEGVGRTAVAGRIPIGFWAAKGSDTPALEGGLEGKSVLEGLGLAKPRVFARSDSGPATVINLWCARFSQLAGYGSQGERSYLLSDIGGLPGQAVQDRLKVVDGNV